MQCCHQQHRNIPRLRRPVPDPFLEIHPRTTKAVGIEDGEGVGAVAPAVHVFRLPTWNIPFWGVGQKTLCYNASTHMRTPDR
jgi:hypothetical protein